MNHSNSSEDAVTKLSVFLTVNEALSWIEFLEVTSPIFYEPFTKKAEEANDMYFAGKNFLKYLLDVLPKKDVKFIKEATPEEITINAYMRSYELAAFSKFIRKCTIVDFEKLLGSSIKSKQANTAAWKIKEMLIWIGTNIDRSSPR